MKNPFEFDGAANLTPETILDFFIPDHNFSRFIESNRNVFLTGERGSGKSMNLLYYSLPIQILKSQRENNNHDFSYIGVYIPCNTPLFHKEDHKLLTDESKGSILSEHFLVLNIAFSIVKTLDYIDYHDINQEYENIRTNLEFIFNRKVPRSGSLFNSLKLFFQSENVQSQRMLNSDDLDSNYFENLWSFSSLIIPLLDILKDIDELKNSHFSLLVDDVHDLNKPQRRSLNSWISYRDHSVFSFKVATAKVPEMDYLTFSGGAIFPGHDFILIDMEQPFQNRFSPFGKFAKEIIEKRLENFGIEGASAEDFFPINKQMARDLEECRIIARREAEEKFPSGPDKSITNYVYKISRVKYFRKRDSKANKPPYSGFEILTHLSTGVIRNLLDPCYAMFDRFISDLPEHERIPQKIKHIPSAIQSDIIIEKSEYLWSKLQEGLDKHVIECTSDQARKIYNLFDNLAILFRKRLLEHESEPRAIVFTISGLTDQLEQEIFPLLNIARRANLLYMRIGPAKDNGKLESYYVPNRLLWPARGLDPQGQHARVSLKAIDIISATRGAQFPFSKTDEEEIQGDLFQ